MKLAEALSIIQKAPAEGTPYRVLLACGFSPLHLRTFLAAHLQTALGNRGRLGKVQVHTGLYGSLAETMEQIAPSSCESGALFLEWPDLDARLGYRRLGGWGNSGISDVMASVEAILARIAKAISKKPSSFPLMVSLPTLTLPPGFHTISWQASAAELALESAVSDFARKIALEPGVLVLSRPKLDAGSPLTERYDFRSDLNSGFPYSIKHTDSLAQAAARLLMLVAPKKGLISDLDDTMWRGIAGEEGAEGVTWNLAGHAQIHGLYQQMLQSLAEQGVLIGIASKNVAETAEKALRRSDCVLKREKVFPVEIHWEPKSNSVSRILKTWNIGAESVVFVDDSPMELDEVHAAHPGIECVLFPKNDHVRALGLLQQLRDFFGKPTLSEEDGFRLESIRNSQEFLEGAEDENHAERFLSSVEAAVTFEWSPPLEETRVLELVNKTNQFNLNGKRFTEAEWKRATSGPDAFVAAISYRDKFGPLGKIAVVSGRKIGHSLKIETWVMSCRAFSRRIEHQTLHQLFEESGAREIEFAYAETPKNSPTKEFLTSIAGQNLYPSSITREAFAAKCPALCHQVAFSNKSEETPWTTLKSA